MTQPITPERQRLRQPRPGKNPMLHRIFRADPMTVREALGFMRKRFDGSANEDVLAKVELALAEVLNNICEHGAQQEALRLDGRPHTPLIHLCVARHTGGIACAVTDDGMPLPTTCLNPRTIPGLEPDFTGEVDIPALPEGGFGWFLIQDLTASLSYFREGRRNFLAFIIPVEETLYPELRSDDQVSHTLSPGGPRLSSARTAADSAHPETRQTSR